MGRVVLDIGKTLAKATLWNSDGALIARETRPNGVVTKDGLQRLDAEGIEAFFADTLRSFAAEHPIESIFPVAHGAAAALVRDGALVELPIDYEQDYDPAVRADYDRLRSDFGTTGSPALPLGLNLGMQLFYLKQRHPDWLDGATILPWPQYWSWLLSGVAANEVSSMGCHTDLWEPMAATPSALAAAIGIKDSFAPLRKAADVLGSLSAEWVERTGLSPETSVHCGIHDSNSALIAARAFPEILNEESTVLSTGTWFIAMRSPERADMVDIAKIPQARDCLVNVDAHGKPVPSARFMGGREIETQIEIDTRRVDIKPDQPALLAAVPQIVANRQMLLPTLAPGTGPFPDGVGQWIDKPNDWYARRAAVCLYAALVTDQMLGLIGSQERLLIEGRFAEAAVFVRAIASLRPDITVYVANAHNDVAFGALRLIDPALQPMGQLVPVQPLDVDLTSYKRAWLAALDGERKAA